MSKKSEIYKKLEAQRVERHPRDGPVSRRVLDRRARIRGLRLRTSDAAGP